MNNYKSTRYINYSFAYRFKNKTNAELYYIVFFTPNKKGLELLKETIWNVFNGEDAFTKKVDYDKNMPKLFDTNPLLAETYGNNIKDKLLAFIGDKTFHYEILETYILEKSMLMEGQIIKYVIKPLIDSKQLIKITPQGKTQRNFKDCTYQCIQKSENNDIII